MVISSTHAHKRVLDYFITFPLKTKKINSFCKWKKVYDLILSKQHLTIEGITTIKRISKMINTNNAMNKKIGKPHILLPIYVWTFI